LDQLGQRLLDASNNGQPKRITMIFGRKVTKYYTGKLQTVIEDLDLPDPVICSHYGKGFLKQYVRDHLCLRTELATNDVTDYGIKKAVENLSPLRDKLSFICIVWPLCKYPSTSRIWLRFCTALGRETPEITPSITFGHKAIPFDACIHRSLRGLLQPYQADSKIWQHK
jgi:hypothetical protein